MTIALVSSAGGHLAQIKTIITREVLGNENYILITERAPHSQKKGNEILFPYLKLNPFRFAIAIFQLYALFRRMHIHLVITTGADLGVAAMVAGRLLRIRTVFIETVIRVKTPTLTGRVAYYFSDIFLVQHPSLREVAGRKSIYRGGIL